MAESGTIPRGYEWRRAWMVGAHVYVPLDEVSIRTGPQLIAVVDVTGLDCYQQPTQLLAHAYVLDPDEGAYALVLLRDGQTAQRHIADLGVELRFLADRETVREQNDSWEATAP